MLSFLKYDKKIVTICMCTGNYFTGTTCMDCTYNVKVCIQRNVHIMYIYIYLYHRKYISKDTNIGNYLKYNRYLQISVIQY